MASAEPANVRLRLRAPGGKDLEAEFPRGVLHRLVLGQEADPARGRPLPGFTPPEQMLAGASVLMIGIDAGRKAPPWAAAIDPLPGEEDPTRIAEALPGWWGQKASAVVGTEPSRSIPHWVEAPKPGKKALLLLPEDAFPGVEAESRRAELSRSWPASDVVTTVPQGARHDLVILVSAEAPGVLAARLRELARSDALAGKLLAVHALTGRVRPDLPVSLILEGKLAGFGLAEASPVGQRAAIEEMGAFARSLAASDVQKRVEEIPGPFLWYF
jgi:hypothetical protein